jgi:MFS family permease
METTTASRRIIIVSIVVAALGYFVDIYDIVLFGIVRVPSLHALGVTGGAVTDVGVLLFNMQMGGMLLGGLLWGILGDKQGRLSVLFGSILLYSLANIANGFVQTIDQYAICRLIAGIGLAGELGAGITLVSEIMPKQSRGYGTTIVAAIGICGAVVASLVGDAFDWRIAYFVGGGLGLALLVLRIGVFESGMFTAVRERPVRRGNFFWLFSSRERAVRYLSCIAIGLPLWFTVGILITFSPETGAALGMAELPQAGKAIMYCYIGLAIGDFASGLISQLIASRKKVVFWFLVATTIFVAVYAFSHGISRPMFYLLCVCLGLGCGYWAIFVTIASEQFGTNIRATVTTTVPNFVRGAVVPLTLMFNSWKDSIGVIESAMVVGGITLLLAFVALRNLDETHGRDLDFVEM